MAIAFTEMLASQSATDANSYTTASTTLTAGRLYLLACEIDNAAVASSVATTGGALSFALIDSNSAISTAGPHTLQVWRCLPGSTVTDTIVMTKTTSLGAAWHLLEVTGMDTSGSNGSGAIVQSKNGGSNTAATSLTVTLNSNIVSGNARYAVGLSQENTAGKPVLSSGTWTLGTIGRHNTPPASCATAWNITPATTDTSVIITPTSSARNEGIILEIAAPSAGTTDFVGMIPI